MPVETPLAHLFPSSFRPASTHGHTLGAPRLYELFAEIAFFGRRRATFQALRSAANVRPGQRILDVGCGTGYFARLLSPAVGPEGLVVGVDASPEMIGYARRQTTPLRNCQFVVGVAEDLEFPAEQFDVVVSSLFLHHLPGELRVPALRQMRRVLRTGGTLLVAEAQVPRQGRGLRLLARLHGYDRMAAGIPELAPLVVQAGFDDVRAGEAPPWVRYIHAVNGGIR
jgi:ubiquinone/menaquinone biosynthesis C-methylase UbiE